MPELPDLQVFAKNLQKKLKGKTVSELNVHEKSKLNVSSTELTKALKGQKISKVYREGKELHLLFENEHVLAFHLMLHGKLFLIDGDRKEKHTLLELCFDDGSRLALTDYQGMAKPTLDPEPPGAPDALSPEANYAYLKEKMSATRTVLKTLLMDQKTLRGIGNAYADEILCEAGISPLSISNKVPDDRIRQLVKAISKVLKEAEQTIAQSHPDIINGEVRDFLKIHNAKQKTSPAGGAILEKTIGGRKTYYTEEQELFR